MGRAIAGIAFLLTIAAIVISCILFSKFYSSHVILLVIIAIVAALLSIPGKIKGAM